MRLLKTLIENNEVVWFYCRDKALAKKFLEQCEQEGFWTLNNEKPTVLSYHKFYGAFDNLSMGYLSNMVWCLTFQCGHDNHIRIDYEKYISDTEDYICHETASRRFDYSDWNEIAYSNGLNHTEFYRLCDQYIDGQSYEEYCAYVYRYLIESSWHYSPEQAVQRMEWEDYYIGQCYMRRESVSDCAVEVGYGCG